MALIELDAVKQDIVVIITWCNCPPFQPTLGLRQKVCEQSQLETEITQSISTFYLQLTSLDGERFELVIVVGFAFSELFNLQNK